MSPLHSLLRYSAATDVGLKRTNNEDTILSAPEMGLWIVADGMGGHAAGEVASAIVVETIQKQVGQGQSVQEAIREAHAAVIRAAEDGIGGTGMGSTVVALHSRGSTYEIAWVGDSRAYLWQPPSEQSSKDQAGAEGELMQLTTDHSYVQMLFDTGVISAEEKQHHPDKNIITQCLGSVDVDSVIVDLRQMEWQPNDWVLLCSDGLSDAVTDEQIQDILRSQDDLEAATQALISKALEQGGRDNISVSLVACPTSTEGGREKIVQRVLQQSKQIASSLRPRLRKLQRKVTEFACNNYNKLVELSRRGQQKFRDRIRQLRDKLGR